MKKVTLSLQICTQHQLSHRYQEYWNLYVDYVSPYSPFLDVASPEDIEDN